MPLPGSEAPPRDPFTPYDVGDPNSVWTYEQLTDEERVVADRGRDMTGWGATNAAFASAAREQAERAAAAAAANQLGVESLADMGVVP